jgi:hypothetical protein
VEGKGEEKKKEKRRGIRWDIHNKGIRGGFTV